MLKYFWVKCSQYLQKKQIYSSPPPTKTFILGMMNSKFVHGLLTFSIYDVYLFMFNSVPYRIGALLNIEAVTYGSFIMRISVCVCCMLQLHLCIHIAYGCDLFHACVGDVYVYRTQQGMRADLPHLIASESMWMDGVIKKRFCNIPKCLQIRLNAKCSAYNKLFVHVVHNILYLHTNKY